MVRRYNNRGTRTDGDLAQVGSVFTICRDIATMAAGDFPMGELLEDCEFVGGKIEQTGDEGTNGTVEVEKWDNVGGSTQTTISNVVSLDAGAAEINTFSPVTSGAELCSAGDKINLKISSCTTATKCLITLYFRMLHYTH